MQQLRAVCRPGGRGRKETGTTRMTKQGVGLWALVGLVLMSAVAPVAAQDGDAGDPTIALVPSWNFVAATESGPVADVFSGTVYVESVFRWDAQQQAFDSWQKGLPASLNTLQEVNQGDALWVRVTLAETWTQPSFVDPRTVELVPGWNTVGWTGPDSAAGEVAARLGAAVVIAYDAEAQAFTRYALDAPALLNTLDTVRNHDGLWVFMDVSGTVIIPGAAAAGPDNGAEESPMAMQLTSAAFGHNEQIPSRYTCDGDDISPPLTLAGIPAGAVSLALIVDDPDAPGGTWVHWVEFNIAPVEEIAEGAVALGTQGSNSWGRTGYEGPCPPSGTHRYFFKVSALDVELDLEQGASKEQVLAAVEGHVLAQAELIGLYSRQ